MRETKALGAGPLLDLLFEDPHVGRCLVAPDGVVLRASRAWLRSTGLAPDEVIGADIIPLLEPFVGRRDVALALYASACAGQCVEIPRRVRRIDGRETWWEGTIDPVALDGGTGLLFTTREVSPDPGRREAEQVLLAGEVRFRILAEESPVVLWARDERGHPEFVNRAFRDFYGVTLEEVEGTGWRTPVHPEDAPRYERATRSALRRHKPFRAEARVRRADGEWRWIAACGRPRFGKAGEYLGHVGVSVDITDRKRVEEALRESEEHFRAFVAASSDVVYRVSPDWSEMRELRGREFVPDLGASGRGWIEKYIPPEDRPRVMAVIQEAIRTRSVFQLEHRVLRVDGSVGWTYSRAIPLFDAGGAVLEWFGTALDITARKRAEEALRESEERLRLFIEHAPAAVAMFDREMCYLAASRRYLDDFKLSLPNVLGRSHYEVFPEVPERWREIHRRCLAGAVETCEEESFPRADGTLDWVRWEIHPWHTAAGEIGGIILFTELVTERKRSMEALRASEAALREADRQKNQFLAMLSHELRNPLAPIRNSLYILDRAAPGGEQAKRAQAVIHRQVGQMTWLIDDLLDVTRIAHGKVQLQPERLDLNELAQRTVEDHRAIFMKGGIRLEVLSAPAEVWIHGDRVRLAQIIGNLLHNSVKFTPRGGETTVTIESDPARGRAVLTVRDTGSGIEPEMLPRLFHPFIQADATLDRSKGGLGLGLALVKGLVEMHGGSVVAASDGLGKGAAFTIVLPLDLATARSSPVERAAGGDGESRRVLVIEDNDDAADTLREVLELDEHVVEVAHNGRDGIEKARTFHPDVVLCDLGLPEMDGYEVARTMRADPELGRIGLIAVSGYAQPEDVAAAKEAGFEVHLAKPPSLEALERAVAAVGRGDRRVTHGGAIGAR